MSHEEHPPSTMPSRLAEREHGYPEVPRSGTQSAARVADVLLLLGSHAGPTGVSEMARELAMPKAVVHRILRSLVARQLVDACPDRTYKLGAAAAALGARALRDMDLRRLAAPVLRRIQAASGETATISALIGTARVYIAQVVSPQQIRMEVELGVSFPLHAGASSKAILAVAPPDLCEHVFEAGQLPQLTSRTVVNPERLRAELKEIRREGVAVTYGERQDGAGSVAAPIFGIDESVIGAVSICGPATRFDQPAIERYKPLVRSAALEISTAARSMHGPTDDSSGLTDH